MNQKSGRTGAKPWKTWLYPTKLIVTRIIMDVKIRIMDHTFRPFGLHKNVCQSCSNAVVQPLLSPTLTFLTTKSRIVSRSPDSQCERLKSRMLNLTVS